MEKLQHSLEIQQQDKDATIKILFSIEFEYLSVIVRKLKEIKSMSIVKEETKQLLFTNDMLVDVSQW